MVFLQHKGTAMGEKCAPVFANLYKCLFEEAFIYNNIAFAPFIKCYKRFIDDLIVMWRSHLVI